MLQNLNQKQSFKIFVLWICLLCDCLREKIPSNLFPEACVGSSLSFIKFCCSPSRTLDKFLLLGLDNSARHYRLLLVRMHAVISLTVTQIFITQSHFLPLSSLFSTVLWKMGFEKWKWNSVCNQLNTKSVGHSTLHYFHVQNPVIVFRGVRQHGISFSAFISGVCSTIRFAVLRVLDNCAASEVVPEWGITGEQFSQRSEVVWKERKKESVRQLKTTCRSLKFLEAKGALGRMLCCFVITRIFDLRKNCNS